MQSARVLSVNVGVPRGVAWEGKTIRTSIFKVPVEGRVWAGRLNLVGNAQADLAGHGGEERAIMVYQAESYAFWKAQLGRDDLLPGRFGENLTVEGLADGEVCVGDRFRIGGAIVEVSQPRVTCYKVGMSLGVPQMPALLVKHGRPGFYLRVIEEGEIGAGDPILQVCCDIERMSVAEIDRLLYGPEHPRGALERANRIAALSPGWQGSMRRLLAAADSGVRNGNAGLTKGKAPLHWTGLRKLQVVGTRMESEEIRSFDLVGPGGQPLPDPLPGQYLPVRVPVGGGRVATRNYSLCGPPGDGRYRIAVKREPEGVVSHVLHDQVREGATIDAGAPRGDFILPPDDRPVVLISAGVGITPVLAMLHAAAAKPERKVWWVHAARDGAHRAFRDEVAGAMARIAGARSLVAFSRPAPTDRAGADYDVSGRIDADTLAGLGFPAGAGYYVCGPQRFLWDVRNALMAGGVEAEDVHFEVFGAPAAAQAGATAPHLPAGDPGGGPGVTFSRSGLTVPWSKAFRSLLELAEACSVHANWSCRSGVCHACETGLIDGEVRYDTDPVDPPAAGSVLLCCSRPVTAVELDL